MPNRPTGYEPDLVKRLGLIAVNWESVSPGTMREAVIDAKGEIERLRADRYHAIDNADRERTEHDELRAEHLREIEKLRADLASTRSVYDFAALEAKIAKLLADIDERTAEQQLFDEDLGEKQRLIDRIADLIGLPKDEELDQVTFKLWFSEIEKLREALKPFADIAAGYAEVEAHRRKLYADEGREAGSRGHPDSHRVSIGLGECRAAATALEQKVVEK